MRQNWLPTGLDNPLLAPNTLRKEAQANHENGGSPAQVPFGFERLVRLPPLPSPALVLLGAGVDLAWWLRFNSESLPMA